LGNRNDFRKTPCSCDSEEFLPEQVEEEDPSPPADPGSPGKMPLNGSSSELFLVHFKALKA